MYCKSKKFLGTHSEMLPLGSLKMYHRVPLM